MSGVDYNELVKPCTFPRYLVVVALPGLDERWVFQRPGTIGLSAAAWWTKIEEGDKTEQKWITVHLPVEQRLDVRALRQMLEAA
jgi:hypothetical protein